MDEKERERRRETEAERKATMLFIFSARVGTYQCVFLLGRPGGKRVFRPAKTYFVSFFFALFVLSRRSLCIESGERYLVTGVYVLQSPSPAVGGVSLALGIDAFSAIRTKSGCRVFLNSSWCNGMDVT